MKVELWPIGKLKPYKKNPRKIDEAAVDAVATSIKEFGFRQAIVVDADGVIVVGHTRYQAALKLGLKKVPVHVARDLTETQAKAYRIADNKTGEHTTWDLELLPVELSDLRTLGFEVKLLSFSVDELARIKAVRKSRKMDPDEVSVKPPKPRCNPGDLWKLGSHRLICGDSTDEKTVARLLDGAVPFIMVTDPPYGVDYDADWRADWHTFGAPATRGNVENDDKIDWTPAYKLFPGTVSYVWHAGKYCGELAANLAAAGLEVRSQIIWIKPQFIMSRCHYHWQHEPCWYAVRGTGAKWKGGRKQSTVWQIAGMNIFCRTEKREAHPTQKPVECMKRPIENHGGPEDDVYDPFLGSGTTLIAAEMLGRRCFGAELNPVYCDGILARWEQFTGEKAEMLNSQDPGKAAGPKTPKRGRPRTRSR